MVRKWSESFSDSILFSSYYFERLRFGIPQKDFGHLFTVISFHSTGILSWKFCSITRAGFFKNLSFGLFLAQSIWQPSSLSSFLSHWSKLEPWSRLTLVGSVSRIDDSKLNFKSSAFKCVFIPLCLEGEGILLRDDHRSDSVGLFEVGSYSSKAYLFRVEVHHYEDWVSWL